MNPDDQNSRSPLPAGSSGTRWHQIHVLSAMCRPSPHALQPLLLPTCPRHEAWCKADIKWTQWKVCWGLDNLKGRKLKGWRSTELAAWGCPRLKANMICRLPDRINKRIGFNQTLCRGREEKLHLAKTYSIHWNKGHRQCTRHKVLQHQGCQRGNCSEHHEKKT